MSDSLALCSLSLSLFCICDTNIEFKQRIYDLAPRKQRNLQAHLKGNEGMLLKLFLKESGVGLLTQTDV